MTIFVVGINHKTASIQLREKIYFSTDKLGLYLQDLLSSGQVREAVLLSTCNRSELYANADEITPLLNWFCAQTVLTQDELDTAIYVYRNEAAVSHIMQVACGLDSMVLGEPQILGQMKAAFSESCAANAVSTLFHKLFQQQVFNVAKEIRSTTAIGACPVSIASAAVRFAKEKFPQLKTAKVALIGAGDTSQLLARYLAKELNRPITLINRCVENAKQFAASLPFRIEVASLETLPSLLTWADIVFSATGSLQPIVKQEMVAKATQDKMKSLLLFDLAVPRDVEPEVAELAGVKLYCVDDLKTQIAANRQGREHAANKALEMIAAKSREFMLEAASLDKVSTTIKAYRNQIEEICHAELKKAQQQLHHGVDSMEVLHAFAAAFMKKLLHTPSTQLRQAGVEGRLELLRSAKKLFAIPDHEVEWYDEAASAD